MPPAVDGRPEKPVVPVVRGAHPPVADQRSCEGKRRPRLTDDDTDAPVHVPDLMARAVLGIPDARDRAGAAEGVPAAVGVVPHIVLICRGAVAVVRVLVLVLIILLLLAAPMPRPGRLPSRGSSAG